MSPSTFLFAILNTILSRAISQTVVSEEEYCYKMDKIDKTLKDLCKLQPTYVSLLPDSPATRLVDNICLTYFLAEDNPDTYHIYEAAVFTNGSYVVQSNIGIITDEGTTRLGNYACMAIDRGFAQVSCCNSITLLITRCPIYGICGSPAPYVFSQTDVYGRPSDSCLRELEEEIRRHGMSPVGHYPQPMALPPINASPSR